MSADDVHVMPVDDSKEHICSPKCPCNPSVEVEGANLVYIHNSWDGREYFEEIDEILNKEND